MVSKQLLLWVILTGVLISNAQAGNGVETGGARSQALGNASVALVDQWSVYNNPGAMGLINTHCIATSYESRYFLPEAGFAGISYIAPLGGGSIGLMGQTYGYSAYRSSRFGLSYGRKLSEQVALGVQVNYLDTRISNGYGKTQNLVAELGAIFSPTRDWNIGVHLLNPTRSKLSAEEDERLATVLSLGSSYHFSQKLTGVLELEKDMDQAFNLQVGMEYIPWENIFIRAGYETLNASYAFGLGYSINGLQIDVSNQWDRSIGFGGAIGLSYAFGKRKERG